MRVVSELFRELAQASATKITPVALLTVTHPEWPETYRYCSTSEPFTSRGQVYEPLPFDLEVPDQPEGRMPEARLTVTGVTFEIELRLLSVRSSPKIKIEFVLAQTPDVVEIVYPEMEIPRPTFRAGGMDATLTMPKARAQSAARFDFTPQHFPDLF
jgi:hypothetical protein